MEHSFNIRVAKEYGIVEAILLNFFSFWTKKNRANKKHFHDGYYWTYNSSSALSELFDYVSKRKIEYAIKHLKDEGFIKTGEYNTMPYDHTTWYAVTEKGEEVLKDNRDGDDNFAESITQNRDIDNAQFAESITQDLRDRSRTDVTPIPVNIPVITDTVNNTVNNIVGKPDSPIIGEVITYLNERTGSHYRATTESTKRHIRARISDGYKLEDFKQVIDTKASQWLKDERMRIYLRPETLFGSKFEAYLNEGSTKKPVTEYADADDFFKSWRD